MFLQTMAALAESGRGAAICLLRALLECGHALNGPQDNAGPMAAFYQRLRSTRAQAKRWRRGVPHPSENWSATLRWANFR
jgi:hypothetical protein